jgi:hypothetical protein
MELVKRDDHYGLYNEDGHKIAATIDGCNSKLSKENCDEIFGVVDVDRLFLETPHTVEDEKDYWKIRAGYIEGFNKAMELNKDKLFTVEDIKKAFNAGWVQRHNEEGSHYKNMEILIQSLQQPKEIEVEIRCYVGNGDKESDSFKEPLVTNTGIPKLDAHGCLILKKKL